MQTEKVECYNLKTPNVIVHELKWKRFTLFTLSCNEGVISIEIYNKPQGEFEVRGWICNLWVKDEYRHKGVGNCLLSQAEHIAKDNGLDTVFLKWHEEDSLRSTLQWYIRKGYKEIAFSSESSLMKKQL